MSRTLIVWRIVEALLATTKQAPTFNDLLPWTVNMYAWRIQRPTPLARHAVGSCRF